MRPGEPFISCSMTLITLSSSVLRRGAGVGGGDDDRRRRHRRVLRDRQLRDRDAAEHEDEQRDHPREDGAVDEEAWPWRALLSARRGRGRRGAAAAAGGGGAAARRPARPRHRLHRRAGRSFWKPSTITCSPGLQARRAPPTGRPARRRS